MKKHTADLLGRMTLDEKIGGNMRAKTSRSDRYV